LFVGSGRQRAEVLQRGILTSNEWLESTRQGQTMQTDFIGAEEDKAVCVGFLLCELKLEV